MKRTQIEKRIGFALVATTLVFWGAFTTLDNAPNAAIAAIAKRAQDRRIEALPFARVILPAPWEASGSQR